MKRARPGALLCPIRSCNVFFPKFFSLPVVQVPAPPAPGGLDRRKSIAFTLSFKCFSLPEVPALAHAHPVHGLARESLAFTLGTDSFTIQKQ